MTDSLVTKWKYDIRARIAHRDKIGEQCRMTLTPTVKNRIAQFRWCV